VCFIQSSLYDYTIFYQIDKRLYRVNRFQWPRFTKKRWNAGVRRLFCLLYSTTQHWQCESLVSMHVNWLKVPERIEYEVISTTHTSFFSSLVLIISTTSSPFSYFDPHDLKSLITLLHPPSQSRLNITKSQAALFDMQHLSWNKLPDSCSIFPTLLLFIIKLET